MSEIVVPVHQLYDGVFCRLTLVRFFFFFFLVTIIEGFNRPGFSDSVWEH